MPITIRPVVADGGPALPSAVESAGYFTVAEALADALKISAARTVQVRLAREIDAPDDGVGGAVIGRGGAAGARAARPATSVLVLSQYVHRRCAEELLGDRPAGIGYLLKQRVADVEGSAATRAPSPPAAPSSTPR